jgi:hypothetical protein
MTDITVMSIVNNRENKSVYPLYSFFVNPCFYSKDRGKLSFSFNINILVSILQNLRSNIENTEKQEVSRW